MAELPVDAAWVNGNAKTFCDTVRQLRTGDARLVRPELHDEAHQFGRQLVAGPRAALVRKQAREACILKRCLSLIERWPRESKGAGCLADRRLVDLHQPEHFVLDLQQIVGVEKLVGPEGLVF